MAEIEHITTHVEDAKSRMLEQYKGATNFTALVEIFSGRMQDLEDVFSGFVTGRSIFTAIGVQLDEIGKIVGITRLSGQTDDSYREDLFVQISINTAQGDPESLILLVKNLTGATIVRYRNLGNGVVSFEIDITPTGDIPALYARIERACLGGVRVDSIIKITSDTNFSFDGDDGPTTSFGFGDANDAGVGGVWAEQLV